MKGRSTATLRSLRISPRKVRLLIDLIRGMRVTDALAQLMVNNKHASRPIAVLLKSAIANAVNNHDLDEKTLKIVTATVDGGAILYRQKAKAFGNVTKVRKRSSHITLVLEGDIIAKTKKAKEEKTDAVVDAEVVDTEPTKVVTKKTKSKKTE